MTRSGGPWSLAQESISSDWRSHADRSGARKILESVDPAAVQTKLSPTWHRDAKGGWDGCHQNHITGYLVGNGLTDLSDTAHRIIGTDAVHAGLRYPLLQLS